MWPSAHPMRMLGMKIPNGQAVPDVRMRKKYQTQANIRAFSKRIVLFSDIKLFIVFD